jgi:hypothetical protein
MNRCHPTTLAAGWIDPAGVDATTEADIALQQAADEADAMQGVAQGAGQSARGGSCSSALIRQTRTPAIPRCRTSHSITSKIVPRWWVTGFRCGELGLGSWPSGRLLRPKLILTLACQK